MYLLIVWHAFSKLTSFPCVFLGFTCLFIKNSIWSSKCARFQFLFQPNMVVRGPRKWLIKFLLLLSLWGGAQLKVQQKIPPYRWGYNGTLSKSFGWRCPPPFSLCVHDKSFQCFPPLDVPILPSNGFRHTPTKGAGKKSNIGPLTRLNAASSHSLTLSLPSHPQHWTRPIGILPIPCSGKRVQIISLKVEKLSKEYSMTLSTITPLI